MHTTIRNYRNANLLAAELPKHSSEVEALLRGVSGFQRFYLIRTDDGCCSITVCDTKMSSSECGKLAAQWMKERLPMVPPLAPEVISGEMIATVSATPHSAAR